MIVTAALAWWDERPQDLWDCVVGMHNIADRLVAVDGAYRRYPGATPHSPTEQVEVIREAAETLGIDCTIYQPDTLWAGQVAKRSYLMAAAAAVSDWVVVLDADHVVHGNREQARQFLANAPSHVNVVSAKFFTPPNLGRSLSESAATSWHAGMSGTTVQIGQIFRAMEEFRVVSNHWVYQGKRNGQTVHMLYGVTGEGGYLMPDPYVVEHRALFRDERHIQANSLFCRDREMVLQMTGQEDDVPGLPDPAWMKELVY